MPTPLYTPEQVRALDERAIAGGLPADILMERAAGHLARKVVALAGRGYGLRVGVLCGKGNNGGDGLAAARRLAGLGAAAQVCVIGGADGLRGLPAEQLARLQRRGGRVVDSPREALAGADVVVDCLLGTGSSGPPRGAYAEAVDALNGAGVPVVACDQPTGVDATSGAVAAPAVRADLTVTLGVDKLGLRLWPARGHCGELVVGDIGLVADLAPPAASTLHDADAAALLPPPDATTHKRRRGVVVVFAGSEGMAGAAALAARAAYAGGAGLVTVATSPAARALAATAVPEALTVAVPEDADRAFEVLAGQLERADALALGPGLGTAEPTVAVIRRLVAEIDLPVVLDADGINAFADSAGALAEHAGPLLALTPHQGELGRLAGAGQWDERAAWLGSAARGWAASVVAKGPGTVTAAPDGRMWVNATGSAALATGGTGDVLTGLLGALLAAEADPARVAAGVHLHGRAGEQAARRDAARAVTAGAVVDALGSAWRLLEEAR